MSFNTALSGLQAASQDLNVTSNNIANSSTTGFKMSRAEFSDVYAASALGTSGSAVGTGTRMTSVSQQFTQGTVRFTDNSLDLAISGGGFFLVNDNGTQVYTRAGQFNIDRTGYIVNSSNQRLIGFLADSLGNITGASGDLRVNTANLTPQATSDVNLTSNLDSTEAVPAAAWVGSPAFGDPPPAANTYNNATSTTIYDSLGNSHILTMYFVKSATPNRWEVYAQVDGVDVDSNPASAPFSQFFNANGTFNSTTSQPINLSWAPLDANGDPNGATTPQLVEIEIGTSTQYGSPFAVQALSQDGFTTGRLGQVDVDSSGVLFGRYTNGQSLALGQISLANFSNVQGLQPLGNTSWGESFGSGPALVGAPGTASLGLLQSGALEESNVPLTNELVKLITAQRNFQANAQSIRTLNAVTQAIFQIN